MPPVGRVDGGPGWGWPDAVLGLVLAVCLCVTVARAVAWLHRRDAPVRAGVRWPERAPVGIGLVLALAVTLLVRGHPDQQVLAGAVALVLAGVSSIRVRPRPSRRRPPDPAIASPPLPRRC